VLRPEASQSASPCRRPVRSHGHGKAGLRPAHRPITDGGRPGGGRRADLGYKRQSRVAGAAGERQDVSPLCRRSVRRACLAEGGSLLLDAVSGQGQETAEEVEMTSAPADVSSFPVGLGPRRRGLAPPPASIPQLGPSGRRANQCRQMRKGRHPRLRTASITIRMIVIPSPCKAACLQLGV
jgi:hypothetical protein